ncbi:Myb-binding protein 1A-like protein [Labeo rohita]|uniref:Myb-binding protein 1A-like protein n=1 Tax=Labeo rohita TaxID=84645 RepID=A0ABQ8MQ88_LABRO|nr:Myb-binding protein 1A-like protein [Labeo rohita]
MQTNMGEIEDSTVRPKVTDAKGILKQNRQFLDYFWDIAKPQREIRLKAIEDLIEHLKTSEKPDELKYSLKRLVDGLSHTREDARSGYSVALAQLLSVFEEISLKSTLDSVKEKHNLQTAQKKLIRNAAFGNFFGVLALSQSTRLHKEPQVMLECVQLLQSLSQYGEHLKDLPRKTIVAILSETSQEVFKEVLLSALQSDLTSALNTPEQLELLLVAMQKFPLVGVLKTAARSVKKENILPSVALDMLQVSLQEESFEMFWNEAIINGMLSETPGPTHYLSFRLLGASLPLLSVPQLEFVLSGDVMRHFGQHMLSAQLAERFKFGPEMEKYVSEFMQGCADADKQLVVALGFTQLTNQGYPVVPSSWKVLEHMSLSALQQYVEWLMEAFCSPQLEKCLEFSTRRQKGNQESKVESDSCVARFRKWIIPRLTFIVENHQIKKQEDLVMKMARFVFFHAFFDVKKPTPEIPETVKALSVPIDQQTRATISSSFYSLLQGLNSMAVLGESPEAENLNSRRILGVKADGSMWIYCMVHMLESVEALKKKAKKSASPRHTAFQLLFLLVGIQMFKAPDESLELLNDLRTCMEKAKPKKKKANDGSSAEEPHWVEVIVEILLSLLSQPSRLIRNKEKKKKHKEKKERDDEEDGEEDEEGSDSSSSDDDDDDDDDDNEAMEEGEEVDQNFRLDLMKVLQGQNALATEEDGSDEEELDDAAMMKLDGSLSALFLEQKKKIQAKKNEKERLRKEKVLVRDFKIKVLDMVEVFLNKQGSSALVLGMVEPVRLCRAKYYCREIDGREAELHEMLERLIGRAQKLTDSSVSLYYFSAALYVLKVLRGVVNEQDSENTPSTPSELRVMGKVDVERVTTCFRNALTSFMTKRKSPLTGAMFIDLFSRFPVLCVNLLNMAVENITAGVREHQQGQACLIVLRALQSKDVRNLLSEDQRIELHQEVVDQLAKSLEGVQCKNKTVHEKIVKALELCQHLVRTVQNQKMPVNLEILQKVLRSMNAEGSLQKPGQLEDMYWSVMSKPKMEKVKKAVQAEQTEENTKKKKKGFLPETKKRKNRKKPTVLEGKETPASTETPEGASGQEGKKKKKNKKRKHQEGEGEETQNQPSTKKAKTPQQQEKKKKKKKGDQ